MRGWVEGLVGLYELGCNEKESGEKESGERKRGEKAERIGFKRGSCKTKTVGYKQAGNDKKKDSENGKALKQVCAP